MQIDNSLIFGKNPTERIVSLESNNDCMELFIQDENGEVISKEIPNRFWLVCNEDLGGFKRLKGESHYKWGKQFTNKRDLYAFKNHYIQKDIFVIYDNKESSMVLKGLTYYKGMKPIDVSILSFDIETTGLFHDENAKILLISNTFRKNGVIVKKLFAYDEHYDEGQMIYEWCKWVRQMDPSILIGHNCNGFDLHYIKFIADKFGVDLKLGRDESIMTVKTRESKKRVDGSRDIHYFKSHIYGREIIDTMFLSINHDMATKKYVSYGLKQIIKQEGLEKANRTFYDASKIRFNYKDPIEWEKIKEYCKDDSDDALALFDLMVPPFFEIAKYVPKGMQQITESASGSQINSIMLRSYIQFGHSIPKASEVTEFKGAISFAIPGIYRNMMKIDFSGLYPSIMREYKVYNKEKDPNANFLELINYFAEFRLKYKKLYKETGLKEYDDMQQACKIFANSMYGFLSTNGINFNYPKGASFITKKARELLSTSILWATGKNYDYWNNLFLEKTE